MTNDNPAPATAATLPALSVRLGDLELSLWHPQLRIKSAAGIATNNATVKLDNQAAESPLLDYAEPLTITATWEGVEYPQFAGYVEYGGIVDGRFTLYCRSNAVFEDFSAGVWLHEGVRVFEIVYTTSRMMGFADDMLRIDGMESLDMEEIEVVVPLIGLRVEGELAVGPYRVVPSRSVDWVSTTWTTDPPARRGDPVQVPADFLGGGAYLVAVPGAEALRSRTCCPSRRRGRVCLVRCPPQLLELAAALRTRSTVQPGLERDPAAAGIPRCRARPVQRPSVDSVHRPDSAIEANAGAHL